LDLIDLSSKVSLVSKVEIIDISLGGVALKADRKLDIGKECLVTLEHKGKHINVRGIVVRSELSGMEEKADGETITIYSVGLFFKDESAGQVKDFLALIENNRKKAQVSEQADWFRRHVRFRIITSSKKVLNLPTQFGIHEISQLGVTIQTDYQLKVDSMLLIELSLDAGDPAIFVGKVIACYTPQNNVQAEYYAGVKFSKLTDRSRSLLIRFIDFVKNNEHIVKWRGK
jgi:c-di-GMP-binding flagellar brake protein YcgR